MATPNRPTNFSVSNSRRLKPSRDITPVWQILFPVDQTFSAQYDIQIASAPAQVTGLTWSSTSSSVTLNWNAVAGA